MAPSSPGNTARMRASIASRNLCTKASARANTPCGLGAVMTFTAPRTKPDAPTLEVKIARKIVTAGLERLQRRLERGFDLDKGARRRRHVALDRQPHAPRRVIDAPAFEAIDA